LRDLIERLVAKRVFEIFTAGMVRWWNRRYSINASPMKEIVVEPRAVDRYDAATEP
jgi:hypothetical protein